MGIEIGLGEIVGSVTALVTAVVGMALWVRNMLATDIKELKHKLIECEAKHLEGAIKVAALEAKVATLQSVEHTTSRVISEIQNTLTSNPCRYSPKE